MRECPPLFPGQSRRGRELGGGGHSFLIIHTSKRCSSFPSLEISPAISSCKYIFTREVLGQSMPREGAWGSTWFSCCSIVLQNNSCVFGSLTQCSSLWLSDSPAFVWSLLPQSIQVFFTLAFHRTSLVPSVRPAK